MYKYHFRPGYGTNKLLIEIFNGAENKAFLTDFLNVIKELKAEVSDIQDLRMNDELLLKLDSEMGEFMLALDSWGLAFVTGENNQECLAKINAILEASEKFEKVTVNFEKYQ